MNKEEKKWIILLGAVLIILIALIVGLRLSKNKNQEEKEEGTQVVQEGTEEKYVEVREDGTKVNQSNKLKESKNFEGLKIENITIETKNNETILKADVENTTGQDTGDYAIKIKVVDDAGNEIKQIGGYINHMGPNEKTQLRIKTSYDFANAYDFTIEKQ